MFKQESKARREKITAFLDEGDLLIAFGGNDELGIDKFPSRDKRDCNFCYLVGMDIPEGLLLMAKHAGVVQEYLFIHRPTAHESFYMGTEKNTDYYRERCSVENILYTDDFDDIISFMGGAYKLKRAFFTSDFEGITKYPRFEHLMAEKLTRAYPGLQIGSLSEEVYFLRLRKDAKEIACLRRAIGYAKLGLDDVAAQLRHGMMEYQVRSIVEHRITMEGGISEGVLVQGGKNAVIMHRMEVDGQLKNGELCLVDIGAVDNGYVCDIARTLPVNGRFTEEQAHWYNVCLRTQELVIENLTPGKRWADCGKEANEYMASELRKAGYLGETENMMSLLGQCRPNYVTPGMVNHGIGLFHGEKRQDEDGRIAPGMVFTVEPGIYFSDLNMGIRIEDDILITEDGYEVLSKEIPKTVEEIEAWMAK